MSELVGRFLSFEEQMGRGLVRFVYYVFLFLLVVTSLFDLVSALVGMFTSDFWPNLGRFLVRVPLEFLLGLLILRVGAEVVIAILSIDDNLRAGGIEGDTMSTGLNPAPAGTMPSSPATTYRPDPEPQAEEGASDPGPEAQDSAPAPAPAAKAPARKKAARKRTTKKAAKKTAAKGTAGEEPGPAKDAAATSGGDETPEG